MSGCSPISAIHFVDPPQPLNSLSTEHCTYRDGFTPSEAVTMSTMFRVPGSVFEGFECLKV